MNPELKTYKTWREDNQKYLDSALNQLRNTLESYIARRQDGAVASANPPIDLGKIAQNMSAPPALLQLCQFFNLSEFECDILLLCAGIEFYPSFAALCAKAQGNANKNYPTFNLALNTLSKAHWSAVTRDGPLRYWNLIELEEENFSTHSLLRIDERILHYLLGVEASDQYLSNVIALPASSKKLVPSHQNLVKQITTLLKLELKTKVPIIQLCGSEMDDKQAIAVAVCNQFNIQVSFISAEYLPFTIKELQNFRRRWERESILEGKVLLLDCDRTERLEPLQMLTLTQFIEEIKGPVIITSRSPLQGLRRQIIRFDVTKPNLQEQLTIWENALMELKPHLDRRGNILSDQKETFGQHLQELSAQFNLSTSSIDRACTAAAGQIVEQPSTSIERILWESCRVQARPNLDELADRVESKSSWQDLVLPPQQEQTLHEIAAHVSNRAMVYNNWGFGGKHQRGLGITALFSGPSGTGKTLAADVLARELHLDLYKIELSSVVSKYIGETEKNLERIFDAAESGGVILLFDEADSIFGKRSDVKDSKDSHANTQVSYLLQRMEAYSGLAILTTNFPNNMDSAFLRRLRFVVPFPFPSAIQRSEIWRRVFPTDTPIKDLKFDKLAQLNVAGGNIRIIALNAAFLAADAKEPVQMKHILHATQTEYTKLEKSLTGVEIAGWI
ncbi:ATPase central domain-containing protein [Hyella patelloides LEGE 07179]|uniref:ATPase central domain-containing protein n=1 Tax=Hyella patelloides LEGE 07179 TaxID=945734 RepID=A0A563VRZ6_9CYAN|nr:ATP-binding protein [Hyella patelloides]VEP14157.1 ATPase central domain-containing protein [Hyella patelloides LEGE 07179]